MSKNHIYPEVIQQFERQIINFIVESGKNKRSSEIESHILAYFFCHPSLTQSQIQDLSKIFRHKKISKGSISSFLAQYDKYGVIVKENIPNKKNAFKYRLKDKNMKSLTSAGLGAGFDVLDNWIQFAEENYLAVKEIQAEQSQTKHSAVIMERLKELSDFLHFHKNLMVNFLSGSFEIKEKREIKISKDSIKVIMKKGIGKIEDEVIQFFYKNPLFTIDEEKYLPLFSYFMTRKRLTQSQLMNLTNLSSGLISEGLNYLLEKKYIELEKIKGIRKRFYLMPSIGYSNYLKHYYRFTFIKKHKVKLEETFQEMEERKEELKKLPGYELILSWVKQYIDYFYMIESGIKIFEKALEYYQVSHKKRV